MTISNIEDFINRFAPELASDVRHLSKAEKSVLIRNGNHADGWDDICVFGNFNSKVIKNCRFFGFVIIGSFDKETAAGNNFCLHPGIYNSTIGNCIIKSNVTINALLYANFYKIEDNSVIHNVGEMSTCAGPQFDRKDRDSHHKWINIINENGGRAVLSFAGMTTADAFLWAKYKGDHELQMRLIELTDQTCLPLSEKMRIIGYNSQIKNVNCISDTMFDPFTIVSGATKIANSSIRSTGSEHTIIGAGVQIKDSIIGFGNHIDSGTQLDYVITGSGVSIHQTARISHSFIGDNSVIGCCEIANCLIFPSHGQHHNNSFLIAAMIGGQSNIAAGATIGSNHNSRTNDGELWAARGFWPGLCTSFKHNSRFASYCLSVKSDYPFELDIPFPFSLILNDTTVNSLVIFPAFYFTNNMYSFIRNKSKFTKRDKRIVREQNIEHDPLAPDTIEEIFYAISVLEKSAAIEWYTSQELEIPEAPECIKKGKELLSAGNDFPDLVIKGAFEKSNRAVIIKKPSLAWHSYRSVIRWYCLSTIAQYVNRTGILSLKNKIPERKRNWINAGGQIISREDLTSIIDIIKSDRSITWDTVHQLFNQYFENYSRDKFFHALGCLAAIESIDEPDFGYLQIKEALKESIKSCEQLPFLIEKSRQKDYSDRFRTFVYDSKEEMNAVLGEFEKDSVIIQAQKEFSELFSSIGKLLHTD